MEEEQSKIKQTLLWLMPTGIEIAMYVFITCVTFVLSSVEMFKNALYFTEDFNPIRAGISYIDLLLQNFVGDRIAGSLSLAIFWGAVGLLVNVIWWLGSNFSTELSNDLVFSRYVHPKDTDPSSQLKLFIERTVVRAVVAIIFILYLNYFFRSGITGISNSYSDIISSWSEEKKIGLILFTIVKEVFMLHLFVILSRLLLLRKKIFNY